MIERIPAMPNKTTPLRLSKRCARFEDAQVQQGRSNLRCRPRAVSHLRHLEAAGDLRERAPKLAAFRWELSFRKRDVEKSSLFFFAQTWPQIPDTPRAQNRACFGPLLCFVFAVKILHFLISQRPVFSNLPSPK